MHNPLSSITLPPYASVARYEGKGNYAIDKYYKLPYRFFYRHKLKMIIDLMQKDHIYQNILDYGSGPGIFMYELKKHALFVHQFNRFYKIDSRVRFELVICASVLEFCKLEETLSEIKSIIRPGGKLIVASPQSNKLTRLYFRLIQDTYKRHSEDDIIAAVSKLFQIEEYKSWCGLYFALRARVF